MRLFAWQPTGHGELSFFVIAETEAEAFVAVNYEISWRREHDELFREDLVRGWGTDYYSLKVADRGLVIENDND